MEQKPPPEDDAFFTLAAFLVASARGAIEEGVFTASLRLLDAAGRLAQLSTSHVDDDFLAELGRRLKDEGSEAYLDSSERYVAFLDEILARVATEGGRRSGLPAV
jgi:hypothetical protein